MCDEVVTIVADERELEKRERTTPLPSNFDLTMFLGAPILTRSFSSVDNVHIHAKECIPHNYRV